MNEPKEQVQTTESISQRLEKYDRIKRMVNWVGGGLVALTALMTTDILKDQNLFMKLIITGIVLSGVLAGHTRQMSDWGETQLRRELAKDKELSDSDAVPPPYQKYLSQILRYWKWALWCTVVTGLVFLLGVWWVELSSLWAVIARRLCE